MNPGPHPFTLRQLQYAVAVAESLSFRKAAERCRVSQPSLSAQLAQMEEMLGVRLFERDRRSPDRVAFGAVDRGLFPDESIRKQFPVPAPSRIDDPADARRVRALVVDLLPPNSATSMPARIRPAPASWRRRFISCRTGASPLIPSA